MAVLGLIGGPLVLIRATLILFDVVDPGDTTDVLVAPEILWEAALGLYPLIKGFRAPSPPAGDVRIGAPAAAATAG
jgi:hypothetical protein